MRETASKKFGKLSVAAIAIVLASFAQPLPAEATTPVPTISPLVAGQEFTPGTLEPIQFNGQALSGFTGDVEVRVSVLGGSGLLHVTQTSGMTRLAGYDDAVSGNVARLGYSGSQADANAMLSTLQYLGDSASGADDVRIDVTNVLPYGANSGDFIYGGHVYQSLLNIAGPISWSAASSAATSSSVAKQGGGTCPGYLATLNGNGIETTNKGFLEFSWLTAALSVSLDSWIGASDQATDGTWTWVSDPDEPTAVFWSGSQNGSSQNGYFSRWLPNLEPNGGSNENYAQVFTGQPSPQDPFSIYFNDGQLFDAYTQSYLVEYGSANCQPQVVADNQAVAVASLVTAGEPEPVTSLSARRSGSAAEVSWLAPIDFGASAITDYLVEYQVAGSANWTNWTHTASTVPNARIENLQQDQTYNFRVSAVSAVGQSPWSTAMMEYARPWAGPKVGVQPSLSSRKIASEGGVLQIVGSGFDETSSVDMGGTYLSFDATDSKLLKIQVPARVGAIAPNLVFAGKQGTLIYQNAFEYLAAKPMLAPKKITLAGKVWNTKSRNSIISKLYDRVAFSTVTCRVVSASPSTYRSVRAFCQRLVEDQVFKAVKIIDARNLKQSSNQSYRIHFVLSD